MKNVYSNPERPEESEFIDAIEKNDVESLPKLIVGVALYDADREMAENAFKKLSSHEDEIVRGNAVLGFGHLSRRFRVIGAGVEEIVKKALVDPSEYVRGQAYAAADDLEHFLGLSLMPSD